MLRRKQKPSNFLKVTSRWIFSSNEIQPARKSSSMENRLNARFDKEGKCASERSLSITTSKRQKFWRQFYEKVSQRHKVSNDGRGTFCSKISNISSNVGCICGKLLSYSAHSGIDPLSFKTKNFSFLEASLLIWVSPTMSILYHFDWNAAFSHKCYTLCVEF